MPRSDSSASVSSVLGSPDARECLPVPAGLIEEDDSVTAGRDFGGGVGAEIILGA
jgi:hypothetical protein